MIFHSFSIYRAVWDIFPSSFVEVSFYSMGSCLCRTMSNQVVDLDTNSYPDVVVERITHISADIHEKIRKRMPKKDSGESLNKNVRKIL